MSKNTVKMSKDTKPLLCRLCTKSVDWYVDVFEVNETNGMQLREAIEELVEVPVARNDGLPTKVCEECIDKLSDFSDFKVMCIKSLIDLQKRVDKPSKELHRVQIPGEGETNLSYNDEQLQQYGLSLENPDGNMHVFSAKDDEYSQSSPKEASVAGSDGDVTGGGEGGFCALTEEGKWLTSKQIESRQQGKQSWQCLKCEKLFKCRSYLVCHLKKVHNVSIKNVHEYIQCSPKEASVAGSDRNVTGNGEGGFCALTEDGKQLTSKLFESRQQGEESWKCLKCGKLFKSRRNLVCHVKKVHNVLIKNIHEYIQCLPKEASVAGSDRNVTGDVEGGFCSLTEDGKQLTSKQIESRQQGKKSWQCLKCGKLLKTRKCLVCHLKKVHNVSIKDVREYIQCSSKEASVAGSDRNVTGDGEGGFCALTEDGKQLTSKQNESHQPGGKSFQCLYCDKLLKTHKWLVFHVKRVHNVLIKNNDEYFQRANVGQPELQHLYTSEKESDSKTHEHQTRKENPSSMDNDRPHLCHICHKRYRSNAKLKIHKQRMHVESFECQFCSRSYNLKTDLRTHKKCHKSGIFAYVCKKCKMEFPSEIDLKNHDSIHTVGDYKCEFCGRKYTCAYYLNAHRTCHTGEKAFQCPTCNRKFFRKCDLSSHKCPKS